MGETFDNLENALDEVDHLINDGDKAGNEDIIENQDKHNEIKSSELTTAQKGWISKKINQKIGLTENIVNSVDRMSAEYNISDKAHDFKIKELTDLVTNLTTKFVRQEGIITDSR